MEKKMALNPTSDFLYSNSYKSYIKSGDLLVKIELENCTDQELFEYFAKKLSFPDYFGYNWDAFNECMGDLEWLHNKRVVLFHTSLPLKSKNNVGNYIEILYGSKQWLKQWGQDLVIIFPPKEYKEIEKIKERYKNKLEKWK